MLLRAYRFTDKFGVVLLKLSIAFADALLDGLGMLWWTLVGVVGLILRLFWRILRPIVGIFAGIAMFFVRTLRRAGGQTVQAGGNAMVRRAARAEMKAVITEDPLKAQNRTLSAVTLLLVAVLFGVVLWATNPNRAGTTLPPVVAGDLPLAALPTATQPILQNTPVPTATPQPALLGIRGSLAYVVRERGQTDIWGVAIGSRSPFRLTNDPADERDPAWSPDGRRLAFASNKDGNWEIYVLDIGQEEATRLTYDLSYQGAPAWSPDGEWLVYESYQGSNLDIYVMNIAGVLNGSESPIRLPANSDAPDFAPTWSPQSDDGRHIGFVSWRDGNQDIYSFSLDDQSVVNLTQTPTRQEDFPEWSPDGDYIAYSAFDVGLEKVFVTPAAGGRAAQVVAQGRAPAWSPDSRSLVAAVDSIDSGQLVVTPFVESGVSTAIIPVAFGSTAPTWTAQPFPQTLVNSGGLSLGVPAALYIEQEERLSADPPYRLNTIGGVSVETAVLSDRVNDSFIALRERVAEETGVDLLGRLDHAFWEITRPPQPGEPRPNWLQTGRAFAVTRNAIAGFPPPIEVVREDIGVDTYWRVYVRVADDAQSGQLGEPLRHMPWDFASRTQGDVEAYDQGGRLKSAMPSGYYVDLTQLAADYGWSRAAAGNDWRANSSSINYWLFLKPDGLTLYASLREIYAESQLGGFVPTPTFAPAQPTATGGS
ncbi:MAG: PD40 domain-containing protein [Anaerolinea sp.]|nr:PD40 domain-containing protein [Anaerolinea sp.]